MQSFNFKNEASMENMIAAILYAKCIEEIILKTKIYLSVRITRLYAFCLKT